MFVTYQISAPSAGGWVATDDGIYTISAGSSPITDTSSPTHFPASGIFGTFQVAVPQFFTVTSTGEGGSGSGSLREGIETANTFAGPSIIQFSNTSAGGATNFYDATPDVITLTSPLSTITTANLKIVGPGANLLKVNGNNHGSVFTISSATALLNVTISGMEITGGDATLTGGGGVFIGNENVTLDHVWLHGNLTTKQGGAVDGTDGGSITILSGTISGNSASGYGGGIYGTGAFNVVVKNSTISGNSTPGVGGGIGLFSWAGGTFQIQNSTITNNTALLGGGGIRTTSGYAITLSSSIVSGNQGAAVAPDIYNSTVNSSFSAIGSSTGYTAGTSSHDLAFGANLKLAALAFATGALKRRRTPWASAAPPSTLAPPMACCSISGAGRGPSTCRLPTTRHQRPSTRPTSAPSSASRAFRPPMER